MLEIEFESILSHSRTIIPEQCGHGTNGNSCEPSSKSRVILQPGNTSGVLDFQDLGKLDGARSGVSLGLGITGGIRLPLDLIVLDEKLGRDLR